MKRSFIYKTYSSYFTGNARKYLTEAWSRYVYFPWDKQNTTTGITEYDTAMFQIRAGAKHSRIRVKVNQKFKYRQTSNIDAH